VYSVHSLGKETPEKCCETRVYSVHSLGKEPPEKFKRIRGHYNIKTALKLDIALKDI
jgi:hypothetical protein